MKIFFNRIRLIFRILRFTGFKHKCINCRMYIRKFLALSVILPDANYDLFIENKLYKSSNFETFNEDNYFCPICMIPDKGRLIIAFLKTLDLHKKNLSILHLTPETGIQKSLDKLFANCNYQLSVFGDESTLNVNIEDEIKGNFDIIICSHILEHVENDKLALRNLYNALNPKGIILFLVPLHKEIKFTMQDPKIISPSDRKVAYGEEDHVRQYGIIDFQDLLQSNFELRTFEVSNLNYGKLGLTRDSKLYIGTRN
jgi:hypothetical protein